MGRRCGRPPDQRSIALRPASVIMTSSTLIVCPPILAVSVTTTVALAIERDRQSQSARLAAERLGESWTCRQVDLETI